jgi:hypothetical protein
MRHKCRSLNSVVLLPSTPPDSPPPDDNKGLRAAIPPVTTHTSCPRSTYNSPRPNGVLATPAWRFCTNRETVGQPFSHSCVQSLNRRTAALGFDAITRPRLRLLPSLLPRSRPTLAYSIFCPPTTRTRRQLPPAGFRPHTTGARLGVDASPTQPPSPGTPPSSHCRWRRKALTPRTPDLVDIRHHVERRRCRDECAEED